MSEAETGRTTADAADGLRAEQRSRWLSGDRTPAEEYLARRPGLAADVALDLIYGEYVLRESLGETPAADDYLRRFPQYGKELRRLFELDRALLADSRAGAIGETLPQSQPSEAARADGGRRAIGRYLIVAPLGGGGQADVFRAVHPGLQKEVVVKLSRRPMRGGDDPDRLRAEGRLLAELDNPALARVYDLDVHDGRVFLVMEYVRGRNLEQYAAEERPPPARAAALIAEAARGLAFAHRRGVLHLDVKPRNIVVDEAGRARVIDFGLARFRHAWAPDGGEEDVSGTPAYMAPEQARGEPGRVGPRTDVFGLGGALYFLLTGSPPYGGSDFVQVVRAARQGAWDRNRLAAAKVPGRLRAVCERSLAPNPDERYAGCEAMAAALEEAARGPTRLTRSIIVAAAVGLVVVIAAGLAWAALGRTGQPPRAAPAPPPAPVTGVAEATPPVKVSVWRGGRFFVLPNATPLRTGDEAAVEIQVPPGMHVVLYLCTSDGGLRLLRQEGPSAEGRVLRYPMEEGATTELTGPAGTEFVFACGRRSGPVGEEDVRDAWGDGGALPALPTDAVLALDRDHVWEVQAGRDFGPTRGHVDPQAEVTRRLEALRGRLRDRCDFLSGTAFAHRD